MNDDDIADKDLNGSKEVLSKIVKRRIKSKKEKKN